MQLIWPPAAQSLSDHAGIVVSLVGRQEEIVAMQVAIAELRAGRGGMVLLSGEAGMGKTALLRETLAAAGLPVFEGRAFEGRTAPYGPIAGVLRASLRSGSTGSLAEQALTQLQSGDPGETPGRREDLVQGLIAAFAAIAADRGPVVLVLEDVHWADYATCEILPEIAAGLAHLPVLIFITHRSDGLSRSHPVRRLRHDLRRIGRPFEIVLNNLSREDSEQLVRTHLHATPAPALMDLLHEKTGGHPFFLEELTRGLRDSGHLAATAGSLTLPENDHLPIPDSILDSILLRVDAISEAGRNLLEYAAVAGSEFVFDEVRELAGTGEFAELVESGLLVEARSGSGVFRHDLVREAIVRNIGWERRRSLHAAVARSMERRGGPIEIIAEHWLASGERQQARTALLAAADHLCSLHAYRDAAQRASRALAIWPADQEPLERHRTKERLAHCLQVSGQVAEAAATLEEILADPSVDMQPGRRADLLRTLATVYELCLKPEEASQSRARAVTLLAAEGRFAEAATEQILITYGLLAGIRYTEALDAIGQARVYAETSGDHSLVVRALCHEGWILALRGQYRQGRELAQQALSLALSHNLNHAAAEAYRRLGSVLDYSSEFAEAQKAYFVAVDQCRRHGVDDLRKDCMSCLMYLLFRMGEWPRSIEIGREVAADAEAPLHARILGNLTLSCMHSLRGEIRPARTCAQTGAELLRGQELLILELFHIMALSYIAELEGDEEKAIRLFEETIDRGLKSEDVSDIVPFFCRGTMLLARAGRFEQVSRCVDSLAGLATQTGNQQTYAILAFALGELAAMQGDLTMAAGHFENALRQMEQLQIRVEQCLTGLRLGTILGRLDNRPGAVSHLARAYRLARNLGMRPLAAKIAAELENMGETVEDKRLARGHRAEADPGLTRRQLEILRMIGEGLTNREIGSKLFISTRTVDMHVRNVFNRLNCRTRAEAVKKALDLGPQPQPSSVLR